jgi:protein-disulfide isomerase
MKNHLGKIFIGVALVAVGASLIYAIRVTENANEGVVIAPHMKGNPTATVTLTEYSDFQCPACASFAPYVSALVDQYGDRLQFEYKHFPLISIHPQAVPGAKAAEAAAQQGKFFEMHDKLFENQSTWSASSNPTRFFETYASELGLDVELFKRHYKASMIEDAIEADFAEARELGLTSTPSFFLNGQKMEFSTFDEFAEQIVTAVGGPTAPTAGTTTVEAAPAENVIPFSL